MLTYRKRAFIAVALASVLQLLSTAYAQTAPAPAGHGSPARTHDVPGDRRDMNSMHSTDMKKLMDSMAQEMATMPMTGNVDRDFAMMMRIHHQGAIDMAQAELATGKDPQMRKLAKEIIAAQKKEIALIDRWLKK